jgi:hypothetical protein
LSNDEDYHVVQCDKDTIIEGLMKLLTNSLTSQRRLVTAFSYSAAVKGRLPCLIILYETLTDFW